MEFKDKLLKLRKEHGYSQEELGYKINVTRQTISNWESGISTPDLNNIKSLANIFEISTDELLSMENVKDESSQVIQLKLPKMHYEYKSNTTFHNIPLVHINIGMGLYKADGILAIGNISSGFISIGLISIGFLSFGVLSLGLLAFAAFACGIISIGAISLGLLSIGAIATGYFSIGAVALGEYSIGACAVANKIAYGAYAKGEITFNIENNTKYFTQAQIKEAIETNLPHTWNIIKAIFISLGCK